MNRDDGEDVEGSVRGNGPGNGFWERTGNGFWERNLLSRNTLGRVRRPSEGNVLKENKPDGESAKYSLGEAKRGKELAHLHKLEFFVFFLKHFASNKSHHL